MATGLKLAAQLSANTGGFAQGMIDAQRSLGKLGTAARRLDGMGDVGSQQQLIIAVKQQIAWQEKLIPAYDKAGKLIGFQTQEAKRLADVAAKAKEQVGSVEAASRGIGTAGVAIGTLIGNLAFSGLAKFKDAFSGVFDEVQTINKLSDSLNVATERIVAFHKIGSVVGVDTNSTDAALSSLNKTLGAVSFGSLDAANKFSLLGMDGKALAAMPLDTAFAKVADRIASIPDPMRKASAAVTVFGDQAANVLPLLEAIHNGMGGTAVFTGTANAARVTGAGLAAMESALAGIKGASADAQRALATLGVAEKDVTGVPLDVAYSRITSALRGVADPAQRAALTTAIFAKNTEAVTQGLDNVAPSAQSAAIQVALLGKAMNGVVPPNVGVPQVPPIAAPNIPAPNVPLVPPIRIPAVPVPPIAAPNVPLPNVPQVPPIQVPAVPAPAIPAPNVPQVPPIQVPKIPAPNVPQVPPIQVPSAAMPPIAVPKMPAAVNIPARVTFADRAADAQKAAKDILPLGEGMAQLADKTEAARKEVVAFADRAASVGVPVNAVVNAQNSLAASLVNAANGTTATNAAFAKLGLSASQLAAIPLPNALAQVIDRMSSTTDPTNKAAASLTLFGGSADAIAPLIANVGRGLDEAGKKAEQTGESFSRVDGAKIELAGASLSQLGDYLKGIARQVLIQVVPIIEALTNQFTASGESGTAMSSRIVDATGGVAKGVAKAMDFVDQLHLAFLRLQWAANKAMQGLEVTGKGFTKALSYLDLAHWGEEAQAIRDAIDQDKGGFEIAADNLARQIDALKAAPSHLDAVDRWFKNLATSADKAAKNVVALQQGAANLQPNQNALADLVRNVDQLKQGAEVFKNVKTPLETFNEQLTQMGNLLRDGTIDWVQYSRAIGKAFDELERSNNTPDLKRPAALDINTQGAQDAINRFDAEMRFASARENPQERVEKVLREALEVQKRTEATQKEIARILAGGAQIKQGNF